MKSSIKTWFIYLMLWELLARWYQRPVLLPSFSTVILRFSQQLIQSDVWLHVFISVQRMAFGALISCLLALALALLAYEFKSLRSWLAPLITLSRSVPNITYILLMLVWFSRELSVMLIVVLIVFPVFYSTLMGALLSINPELLDVLQLYPEKLSLRFVQVYIPSLKIPLYEGLKSALSLGFKVAIMAEILGQVQPGLGYLMHLARIQFDMAGLFAYTIWMIVIVGIIEHGLETLIKHTKKTD